MKPRIIDRIILITRDGLRQEYSGAGIERGAREIRIPCASDCVTYGFNVVNYSGKYPPIGCAPPYRVYRLYDRVTIDIGDTQEVFAFYKEQA